MPEAEIPTVRPRRDESLMVMSGLGLMGVTEIEVALRYADRARFVQYVDPTKRLRKLKRITKLELNGPPPAWIAELRHLRTLICSPGKALPAGLLKLPRLRYLHIDDSDIARLDGIETMAALETVTLGNTPVADKPGALDAIVAKVDGASLTRFMSGLDFKRVAPKPPRARQALIAAIADDTLHDGADLRGVDLSGARFEDAYITHDLRGANLAGTTWLRCDFEYARFSGADLAGATFYDCYFSSAIGDLGTFYRAKARGVTFIGCGGELAFTKADVRDARLLDMDPDVGLELVKANARGLVLQASFCSEKEHGLAMKGADLRGAQLAFDVTDDRRAELKRMKKKAARLAWRSDHAKGAKIDKTTRITYAPLDAASADAPTRPAARTVDPAGKAAPILGRIYAANVSLWLIVADADVATRWRGAVDEDDRKDDFQRALRHDKFGAIAIGDDSGVCVEIGYRSGWSHICEVEHGIQLLDAALRDDDRAVCDRGIALRTAQWPICTMPKVVGKVISPTGILALMLPYRDGAFPPKLRAKAKPGHLVEDGDSDRVLVTMRNGPGIYEVTTHPFRPERGKGDYEDALGEYGQAILITYRDRVPKSHRAR